MNKRILSLVALAALAGCQTPPSPIAHPSQPAEDVYQTQLSPSIGHLKQPLDRHKQKWYDKHGFVLVPEPAIAQIQALEVKPDVPAEAWDSATLTLESLDPPLPPQTLQLYKDTDLLPLDGSYMATGSLFPQLSPGSYAWTVSLWKGGPTGTLVGEDRKTLKLVDGVNSVKLSPVGYPALGLVDFDPTQAVPGATVSLLGQGFSVLPAQDMVTIGGQEAPVVAASSTRLTVVAPSLAPGSYVVWVQVGSGMVGKTGFGIAAP